MDLARFRDYPHLPQCTVKHASIHYPVKIKLSNESLLCTPKSMIIDGIISYGGSTGIGLTLPCKAYGEYYERNHLFTGVQVSSYKKLNQIQPLSYQEQLSSLCQLKVADKESCLDHVFAFTQVFNLFDDQPQEFFYNGISLTCNKEDSPFINYSDSCACASHPKKEKALYNSLMEFIERQALLGSWLSQSYQYCINPQLLKEVTPYEELAELFLDNGELYIFHNGNKLPGHTVIMFYFASSDADMVQYSIGSSSGLTLEEALLSSFEELYQCYSFLYNMESSVGLENKAGSGYHLEFQKCNTRTIRETIPFMNQVKPCTINSIQDLNQVRRYTTEELLAELQDISRDIYYYHAHDKALGLHFTKILSPDFFTHMSLNNNLNIQNKYARLLNITQQNAFMGKIPFP
ncbi:YcaO-like family protein [Legionella moravica]|uniref:Bacteriocin biosynthesis docking scaffold, SagD family n=1 Tax=Legionella moravica TaxID=39962 RepID=A0A378K033_9GAMM|nr:YcaO-like family protein [Legionella moravica]KTD31051.1 YcaO-like family protein [Legionella moravica]STX63630.1 bacteriocin biosynthesis docking scaffold, SagD family [Legionella moravica]